MKKSIIVLALALLALAAQAQQKGGNVAGIAFYNLENLFDTIPNNPEDKDVEFTPLGKRQWTSQRYWSKIHNLAYTISQMTTATTPYGPAIIGIAEVENKSVVDDLVADEQIAGWNLQVVHHDSPDQRGIDVACLYNPEMFTLSNVTAHAMRGVPFRTRDVLCVVGELLGEKIAVLVNHWPSRLGGEAETAQHRMAAAAQCLQVADSLWRQDPDMGVIIMGDLNDDPQSMSCARILQAKRESKGVEAHQFFNPWWRILDGGVGTLSYKGQWNLFDQIILSGNLVNTDSRRWHFLRAEVLNKDFLTNGPGPYQGTPLRTYAGGRFLNGYSDHFPTEVFLIRTF